MPQERTKSAMKVYSNHRLIWFRGSATSAQSWGEHWSVTGPERMLKSARSGDLGPYTRMMLQNLPQDRPILEAGCGVGQIVLALQKRGYQAQGVDYSRETIEKARELEPGLPVAWGDVTSLDFPGGHFGAYISLGVLEHFRDGPAPALAEAARVLGPGGVLLMTVPYLNPLRALKGSLRLYPDIAPEGMESYQYALAKNELRAWLTKAGFTPRSWYHMGLRNGLARELPPAGSLLRNPSGLLSRAVSRLDRFNSICRVFGHVVGVAAVKNPG